jgi:membrane protein required for colicin V production
VNALDILLVVVVAALVVFGLVKGLVRLLVAVAAFFVAFYLASRFHETVASRLDWMTFSPGALRLIAYVVIFLGVLVAGAVLGWLLRNLVKAAMLGFADRLAGAALGLVVGVVVCALVILPLAAYLPKGSSVLERSRLAPYAAAVADVVNWLSPEDLGERYRKGIESARKFWRGEAEPAIERLEEKAAEAKP